MAEKPNTKAADEPSIEEILGSIRRIIAEDDTTPPANTSAAAEDDEPLELTNKIEPDGTIVNAAPPAVAEQVVETVELAFVDDPDPAPVAEPEPAAIETPPAPQANISAPTPPMESSMANDFPQDDVLSDSAANAAAAAMAKLARQAAVTDEGHDGITIEGIVREMLRPLLREWLDKNLPDLVQKSVERELEKLSKRV
jgi:cell pole-organizing protein PopZ